MSPLLQGRCDVDGRIEVDVHYNNLLLKNCIYPSIYLIIGYTPVQFLMLSLGHLIHFSDYCYSWSKGSTSDFAISAIHVIRFAERLVDQARLVFQAD